MTRRLLSSNPSNRTADTMPTNTTPELWRLVIPGWVPPSLNMARGHHWSRSRDNTKAVAEMVAAYALKAGVPLVSESYRPVRRVLIDVTKYGKLMDPDNLLKSLLDGLKLARLIVDDSAKWCVWSQPTMEQLKGPKQPKGWGTVIVIQDVIPEVVHTEQPAGVKFTRAVFRKLAWHVGLSGEPSNFLLYFDCDGDGGEEVFLSYASATKPHRERLVKWCERLGVSVEYEGLPAAAPMKAEAVADPELFG